MTCITFAHCQVHDDEVALIVNHCPMLEKLSLHYSVLFSLQMTLVSCLGSPFSRVNHLSIKGNRDPLLIQNLGTMLNQRYTLDRRFTLDQRYTNNQGPIGFKYFEIIYGLSYTNDTLQGMLDGLLKSKDDLTHLLLHLDWAYPSIYVAFMYLVLMCKELTHLMLPKWVFTLGSMIHVFLKPSIKFFRFMGMDTTKTLSNNELFALNHNKTMKYLYVNIAENLEDIKNCSIIGSGKMLAPIAKQNREQSRRIFYVVCLLLAKKNQTLFSRFDRHIMTMIMKIVYNHRLVWRYQQ